jgi:signal transduction histidine kinase
VIPQGEERFDEPFARSIEQEVHRTTGRQFKMAVTKYAFQPSDYLGVIAYGSGEKYIINASVELRSDGWINASDTISWPNLWAQQALISLCGTVIIVVGVVLLLVSRIIRPLRSLAIAAGRLGQGETLEHIPNSGPNEVRKLTKAFNDMADRLTRLLLERAGMLAAIGHDLRSPLTAMQLRVEMIDDDENRVRLGRCLDEIQVLVDAALALSRGSRSSELKSTFSVTELMEELVGELNEAGGQAVLLRADDFDFFGQRAALKRTFRNIAENAMRYGDIAKISLLITDDRFCVVFEDEGPGVPEGDREKVFAPFVRLEGSRSRETGGSGVGLALAKLIVESHGGMITFEEPVEMGARAVVSLPLVGFSRQGQRDPPS